MKLSTWDWYMKLGLFVWWFPVHSLSILTVPDITICFNWSYEYLFWTEANLRTTLLLCRLYTGEQWRASWSWTAPCLRKEYQDTSCCTKTCKFTRNIPSPIHNKCWNLCYTIILVRSCCFIVQITKIHEMKLGRTCVCVLLRWENDVLIKTWEFSLNGSMPRPVGSVAKLSWPIRRTTLFAT